MRGKSGTVRKPFGTVRNRSELFGTRDKHSRPFVVWAGPGTVRNRSTVRTSGQAFQALRCWHVRNRSEPFKTVHNRSEPFLTVRNRSEPFPTVPNRLEPFGTVRNRSEPFGTARNRSEPFGPVRNGTVRNRSEPFGTVRNRSEPFGTVRNRSDPSGPFGTGRNRSEPFGTVRNRYPTVTQPLPNRCPNSPKPAHATKGLECLSRVPVFGIPLQARLFLFDAPKRIFLGI